MAKMAHQSTRVSPTPGGKVSLLVLWLGGLGIGFILLAAVAGWWVWQSGWLAPQAIQPGQVTILRTPAPAESSAPAVVAEMPPTKLAVEAVVSDLAIPWSIVFPTTDRWLVSERPGRIRVVMDGQLQPAPLLSFPEVSSVSEEGLMGLVLDPNYRFNHKVYACVAYARDKKIATKVVSFVDAGSRVESLQTIIDFIPAAKYHAGCRLAFGPDEKLYITTGDALDKAQAQQLASLAGKILRINSDGSIPADNPFPNSPVFSYGHRNPQGIDWSSQGVMVETEHGPSGNDGPGGGDEVNIIVAGQNYGWPIISHQKTQSGLITAPLVFTPAVAPASGIFYSGKRFPAWADAYIFGALRGEGIFVVYFDPHQPTVISKFEKLAGIDVGRVREVAEGPDGTLYFTTSNTDGRGQAQPGDDKIYRLVPN